MDCLPHSCCHPRTLHRFPYSTGRRKGKGIKKQIAEIEKTLENFDSAAVKKIIEKYLATMIFVEISDAGYIIYNIPERWDEIIFNTQGVDIDIENTEYGRLILSY